MLLVIAGALPRRRLMVPDRLAGKDAGQRDNGDGK
jgi:hypothetical protein